jgi:hypothetical protein
MEMGDVKLAALASGDVLIVLLQDLVEAQIVHVDILFQLQELSADLLRFLFQGKTAVMTP